MGTEGGTITVCSSNRYFYSVGYCYHPGDYYCLGQGVERVPEKEGHSCFYASEQNLVNDVRI